MMLVANLVNTKWCKNTEKMAHGTHLKVRSESYPMNTNMAGLRCFSKNRCIFVLWTKVVTALEGLEKFVIG